MTETTRDVEGLEFEAAKMEAERESLRVTVETSTNGVGVVAITKREVTGATLRLREGAESLREAAAEIRRLRCERDEWARKAGRAIGERENVRAELGRRDAVLWEAGEKAAWLLERGATNEARDLCETVIALAAGGDDE